MSVNSVTARSTRWFNRTSGHLKPLTAAQVGARPALTLQKFRSSGIESFGRAPPVFQAPVATGTPSTHPMAIRGTAGTHRRIAERAATKALQKRALKKLAFKLIWKAVKPRPLEILSEIGRPLAMMIWNQYIDPTGFPGWGTFPTGWTSNPGTVYPGKALGSYTANGFDNVNQWSAVALNLIDQSDGTPIFGFRYWGHYDADPEPAGGPGVDWTLRTYAVPSANVAPLPYTRLRNLAVGLQASPWAVRSNIAITIRTDRRDPIDIKQNVPRKRDREDKAKPANGFIWLVLKRFADAGGETKEWTDILADASGYIKGSMMLPPELRDTGKETQAKLYWLFVVTGINSIDWEELAVLIVENEVEDRVYGALGQLSKSAAISLGMTVGPQTGLVM